MQWRIWFKGGEHFDGETAADWAALPDDGVLGIAIVFGKNEYGQTLGELVNGSDWYWMHNEKIFQSGTSSLTLGEWLPHNAPEGAVLKKGRWVTDEEFVAVHSAMLEWVK